MCLTLTVHILCGVASHSGQFVCLIMFILCMYITLFSIYQCNYNVERKERTMERKEKEKEKKEEERKEKKRKKGKEKKKKKERKERRQAGDWAFLLLVCLRLQAGSEGSGRATLLLEKRLEKWNSFYMSCMPAVSCLSSEACVFFMCGILISAFIRQKADINILIEPLWRGSKPQHVCGVCGQKEGRKACLCLSSLSMPVS